MRFGILQILVEQGWKCECNYQIAVESISMRTALSTRAFYLGTKDFDLWLSSIVRGILGATSASLIRIDC